MNIRKRTWTTNGVRRSSWCLDWRPDKGQRIRKHFRTRQEAELAYQAFVRRRNAAQYDTLIDRLTLGEFLSIYEAKKPWRTETYRTRTMISLNTTFARFTGTELTCLTAEMIEAVRDERLAGKTAPATVRQDLAALSDCLQWAMKLRYLHESPMARVERPSLPTKPDNPAPYLTPETFGDLLSVARQDAPLYEFAVWTGMRESELLALEWPDIKDGFVTVRLGKGRKQRIIPLVPQALAALAKVARRLKEPRVFWWVRSRYDIYRRFRRRLRWAGLAGYRFHDLRHTFASYAAMSGVDIRVIAEALGHAHTTVTRRYAHLSPEYRRQELQKLAAWPVGTRRAQEISKSAKE